MSHTPRKNLATFGRAGAVLLFATSLTLCSSGAAGAALRPGSGAFNDSRSASSLEKTALRNAVHDHWVHEDVVTTGQGHTVSMSNDIGSKEGRQVVTADGGHAQVIVIDGNAYIEADASATKNYFGLPDPQQTANKWLVLTPADSGFSSVSDAVTLKSDFGHYHLKGKLKKGPIVVADGVRAIPIHGDIASPTGRGVIPITLYVPATGTLLPIEAKGSGHGLSSDVHWSDWGQPVSLAAPGNVTPITNFTN